MDAPGMPPIERGVARDQGTLHGMSSGELYTTELLRSLESSIQLAGTHLNLAQQALDRIKAAQSVSLTWQ